MIAFGMHLLKVSFCLTVFYVGYALLFKNTTFFRFNRCYLLFSLLASFVLPFIQLHVFSSHYELVNLHALDTSLNELYYDSDLPLNQKTDGVSTINYVRGLSIIYFTGLFVLLIRFGFFITRMVQLKRNLLSCKMSNLVVVRTKLLQPFSFLHWVFLPEDKAIDPFILDHERAHVNQYHWVDLFFVELASVVLWFNPLMMCYRNALKLQHEYLADAYTIENGAGLEEYLNGLLTQIEHEHTHRLINQFYSKSIKEGIVMMTKDKTPQRFSGMYLLLIPFVCLMLVAFSAEPVTINVPTNDVVVADDSTPSIAPVDMLKAKISSGYGERMHPVLHKKQMHLGIDLILAQGEAVMSTADGVVVESVSDKYRGNYVIVKHDEIYTTSYSHLESAKVKAGDKIQKGQLLGFVGSTGISTVAHLHYEVFKSGKNVNPEDYLPK